MEADRIRLAEQFLREAVYRARAHQAAFQALRAGEGACGLGAIPAARIRDATSAWVGRQDAFDRARNHFLKDFRSRHGFDRNAYAPEVLADFESGLARIGAEEDAARRQAAEQLLASGD